MHGIQLVEIPLRMKPGHCPFNTGHADFIVKRCRSGHGMPKGGMTALAYIGAALAEIAGCFAFWAWLRLDKSPWWLAPGMASLSLFAYLLTLVEAEHAGRTYAAYGGVYIVSAIAWLWVAENVKPDRWDVIGGSVSLIGAAIILWGPRAS